ncbi:Hypothetical predicted protein, partial [Pelobates cultripes]
MPMEVRDGGDSLHEESARSTKGKVRKGEGTEMSRKGHQGAERGSKELEGAARSTK